MAIITRIRQLSTAVIAVIFIALGLFIIGGDLLSPNSSILNVFNSKEVARINGVSISPQEFNEQLQISRANLASRLGRAVTEAESDFLRYEALNELIYKHAMFPQIEKAGLMVTPEEVVDMVQGNNIHPELQEAFRNPQTGEVDRNQIITFLNNLASLPADQRAQFEAFERSLAPTRLRQKYFHLLKYSTFATKQEAETYYHDLNDKRAIKFLFVPFSSIPDSVIKYTEADLQAFLTANQSKYKRKENRAIEYVTFSFKPSSKDTADIKSRIMKLKEELATVPETSLEVFVSNNSDLGASYRDFKPADIPQEIAPDSLKVGAVLGPYLKNGYFIIYRIVKSGQDSVASAKASHILFRFGDDKQKAKQEAEKVLAQLKAGADFAFMANMYSQDPGTQSRGGDLGWFTEKQMVEPFEKAVMNATKTGLLPNLVETEYGYHIIKVTGLKTRTKYTIAAISKDILPSEATKNEAFMRAGEFAKAKNAKEYADKVLAAKDLISIQALTIPEDATNINDMTGPRIKDIVRWAYADERQIGDVSEVFELEDRYLVAMLRGGSEEGDATVADVREELINDYRKQKKAEMIREKLSKLKGNTLEELQKAYGAGAEVIEQTDINPLTSRINQANYAPNVVGATYALKKGERSRIIQDDYGMFIIEVTQVDNASDLADYATYKKQLEERRRLQAEDHIVKAIKKLAKIKDNTARYF
ncbi:MAG: peptidylprolyl isomerase [Cytophagales bacterium]|nr:peptidylprolyl isomerase [Bernardetiaceae bacterium]MDW8203639.1 peptidylprolyl isomerase [Cytophagales bacterium]